MSELESASWLRLYEEQAVLIAVAERLRSILKAAADDLVEELWRTKVIVAMKVRASLVDSQTKKGGVGE